MSVEIGDVLHVLAHELRTPVGIAHGYVRLLLEDRLQSEIDRRRALEQLQKALSRLTDLSHEASALANWYERDESPPIAVDTRVLLDAVMNAAFGSPVDTDVTRVGEGTRIATADHPQLERALVDIVRSTARELRGATCTVTARTRDGYLELLVGRSSELEALAAGPGAPDAGPVEIDRGGLGLALVHASVVLEANRGTTWSRHQSRQALGMRLPLHD
jgi:signal transduction histidine kinase